MEFHALECLATGVSRFLPSSERLSVSYMLDMGDEHNLFVFNEHVVIESFGTSLIVKNRVGPAKVFDWADPDCFKLIAEEALISAGY
jgi:hypothetical protein